jgi:hypothetical protein
VILTYRKKILLKVYIYDFIMFFRTLVVGRTKLLKVTCGESLSFAGINFTECCKVGPITKEKFCPKCGNMIVRD